MPVVSRTAARLGRQPLIVHSHLRWDFVWQRPQQILSRLARSRAVLYVEEPVFVDDIAVGSLAVSQPNSGIHRVIPRLPSAARDSYDHAEALVRSLLLELIGERGRLAGRFDDAVQWFYTPMPARTMLGACGERAVVYDCMDELAQFRFAPPDLASRERLLMACADVVFAGGHRLYESKARLHHNVHFFGCGVDAEHFARARSDDTRLAAELIGLPRPIVGYFGVVDERLDYDLIARLAGAFAHGSVVFVGPLAKIDPRELPRAANIHWLGQRPYGVLPEYVKGFDVCLMPFALNEATEFINPTKTLEYMAAGKPIVSTAVPDVIRNFAPVVRVAYSVDEFLSETASATTDPDPERLRAEIARASEASWESIVAAMDGLIAAAVRERGTASTKRSAFAASRRPTGGTATVARPGSIGEGATSSA